MIFLEILIIWIMCGLTSILIEGGIEGIFVKMRKTADESEDLDLIFFIKEHSKNAMTGIVITYIILGPISLFIFLMSLFSKSNTK